MIPKIIHYCWFGRSSLPESAQKCIASWRKFLPDYEIWQWSEEANENGLSPALPSRKGGDNRKNLFDKILAFDVNSIQYTREAYEAKKYAFVSDYARFWILYHYGGLYFDTDVEIIKPMDDIIENGPFMGIEIPSNNGSLPKVAPGLGLGAEPAMTFYKDALEKYSRLSFLFADGTPNLKTIVSYNTELLEKRGLQPMNDIQIVDRIWIYPVDFFNPFNDLTGQLIITTNTRTIHWYSKTWQKVNPFRMWLSRMSHRVFGTKINELRTSIGRFIKKKNI